MTGDTRKPSVAESKDHLQESSLKNLLEWFSLTEEITALRNSSQVPNFGCVWKMIPQSCYYERRRFLQEGRGTTGGSHRAIVESGSEVISLHSEYSAYLVEDTSK
jgi:hypothetical protein